jgi:hypothetical protein
MIEDTEILAALARRSRKLRGRFWFITQGAARGLALPWAIIFHPTGFRMDALRRIG